MTTKVGLKIENLAHVQYFLETIFSFLECSNIIVYKIRLIFWTMIMYDHTMMIVRTEAEGFLLESSISAQASPSSSPSQAM